MIKVTKLTLYLLTNQLLLTPCISFPKLNPLYFYKRTPTGKYGAPRPGKCHLLIHNIGYDIEVTLTYTLLEEN